MTKIVEETRAHEPDIADLHRAAFGGEFEVALVARLHRDGLVAVSLVALDDDAIVGHILFSALAVEVDGRNVRAVSLVPLAVRPDRRRTGIGARLVEAGLARLRGDGWNAVIVLGHPGYYARFGFSTERARKLSSPYTGDAFMALALTKGALDGKAGSVRYPAAFDPPPS